MSDLTMFVVDDEPHILSALQGEMSDCGYRVLTALTAERGMTGSAGGGIGLALVKKVMELHNDAIRAGAAGFGRGGCIELPFPVTAGQAGSAALLPFPGRRPGCRAAPPWRPKFTCCPRVDPSDLRSDRPAP